MKGLIIVESPGKVKKIQGYVNKSLGQGYVVAASVGHVRDLPSSELGVNSNYAPSYEISSKKRSVVSKLRKLAKEADAVYLAMDNDREGEGIAWHLTQVIGKHHYHRVLFNEITEAEISKAFSNTGQINGHLVEAQETRRVLDRLVGYKVSPELRQRENRPLSAGRVQSVAVKIIDTRRKDIDNFVALPYIDVHLILSQNNVYFKAKLLTEALRRDGETHFNDIRLANTASGVKNVRVVSVESDSRAIKPKPPLITSTMQQLGSSYLGVSPKKVMELAQSLFEAGVITYHRTDAPVLSSESINAIRDLSGSKGWPIPEVPHKFKVKGEAQGAHEAIRPTAFSMQSLDTSLVSDKKDVVLLDKLYGLIWKRAVMSQLASGVDKVTRYVFSADEFTYESKGSVVVDLGWRVLDNKAERDEQSLPLVSEGEVLDVREGNVEQLKTKPPSMFTESTLVAKLEKEGVGRPSTYASIIDKILSYGYVRKDKKFLDITESGKFLVAALDKIFSFMEIDYTRNVEKQLDDIASGKDSYLNVVRGLDGALNTEIGAFRQAPVLTEQHVCPKCNSVMSRRNGKKAKSFFWGCNSYPECKHTMADHNGKPVDFDSSDAKVNHTQKRTKPCPKCDGQLLKRKSVKGPFYGCSNYPTCNHSEQIKRSSKGG